MNGVFIFCGFKFDDVGFQFLQFSTSLGSTGYCRLIKKVLFFVRFLLNNCMIKIEGSMCE